MRTTTLASLVLGFWQAVRLASGSELEIIPLPPLRIHDQAASAHTQGLELVHGQLYVTARLETDQPKRAILARTTPQSAWDTWDITPPKPPGATGLLDHPGGFQCDGESLWIPVSESRRHGRTVVRVFPLNHLKSGQVAVTTLEFGVADHIGALAIAPNGDIVLGASWDTETVYVWDLKGRLQKTLSGRELMRRNLGVVSGPGGHAGVAVQDWKISGERLYASGLLGEPDRPAPRKRSRLLVFTHFLDSSFECEMLPLPVDQSIELAQEAMTLSDDFLYYLPENLGSQNRCFRLRLPGQLR